MSKFKVGDKVKVRPYEEVTDHYGIDKDKWKDAEGKTYTVDAVNGKWLHLIGFVFSWDESAFEPVIIYASDLMTAVRDNSEKYEGKRYRVASDFAKMADGQSVLNCRIEEGHLVVDGTHIRVYFTESTTLEEIKPEPKPVPFMDAVNSENRIGPKGYPNFEDLSYWICKFPHMNEKDFLSIINGDWYIEE